MSINGTRDMREQQDPTTSDYWLDHCEGFRVFGPDGRIGFVEQVRFSGERAEGFVVRTGLFRTKIVFVQLGEIGSVLARRRRLDLVVAPRIPREPVLHLLRELCAVGGRTNLTNDGKKVARHERGRDLRPASDLVALAASNGASASENESRC